MLPLEPQCLPLVKERRKERREGEWRVEVTSNQEQTDF